MFCIVDGKQPPEKYVQSLQNDLDGGSTVEILKRTRTAVRRMTGTSAPSLGLHPAVYFYNEKGKHSRFLFLGVLKKFAEAINNNDKNFFHRMTKVRGNLEDILVENKSLINQGLANVNSGQRIDRVAELLSGLVKDLEAGLVPNNDRILFYLGLKGEVSQISLIKNPIEFSDDNKSAVFLKASLKKALRCPICNGYLDPAKAVSYDHQQAKKDGGTGETDNCQLTHPFCNTGVKS